MTPPREEQEPTRDQLLAMAFCDGELREDEQRDFEARLAREPELLREVSELRSLEVLSRRVAPRESGDFVRDRLAKDPVQSGLSLLAIVGLAVGAALALGCGGWAVLTSAELSTFERTICICIGGGLSILLLLTLRQRLMLLPHDPYRSVHR